MRALVVKLLFLPLVSYIVMIPILGIMTSVMGTAWIRETLDSNALPVWLVIVAVLGIITVTHHFIKGKE